MLERPRIINVERKPSKCPVCGERVVDIIYGTGDMTEVDFMLEYRQDGIMGGDNIPRRPPIWACSCGCKHFRKVNPVRKTKCFPVNALSADYKNVLKSAALCFVEGVFQILCCNKIFRLKVFCI